VSSPGLAYELAEMSSGMTRATISPSAAAAAQRMVVHIFGMALLGSELPVARQAVAFARHEPGDATVLGTPFTAAAGAAAFANATLSHADFREDSHGRSSSHPGVGVIPAALAIGEAYPRETADPGAFLEAVVQGYEVTSRLGAAGSEQATERGFRPSSLYPGFGAAVAAARMLGLSTAETAHAISLTVQMACGVTQPFYDGVDDWYFSPGFGARAGITGAILAAEGAEGAPRSLEGAHGFLAAFTGNADRRVDTSVPSGDDMYAVEESRLKRVLTCGWNQTLVYLLDQVPGGLQADDLRAATVFLSPQAAEFPGVDNNGPFTTKTEALLSSPYAVALKLRNGELTHEGYEPVGSPEIRTIASRVSVVVDPTHEGYTTRLDIERVDGTKESVSYGGDQADHGLGTIEDVTANLERSFGAAGRDPGGARRLEAAAALALERGDVRALGKALAAPGEGS
jgi:2-methylcitrate dehydratase PrpD